VDDEYVEDEVNKNIEDRCTLTAEEGRSWAQAAAMENDTTILSINHSLYLSKLTDTEPMNTKLFFVLTSSEDKKNPHTTPWKFVNDGFVADTFRITITGILRMTNTSLRMILKQAFVPPNFEINETIRSAACHRQKLQPDCMVGLGWKINKCTYLTFAGKSKTEMETYLLSDLDMQQFFMICLITRIIKNWC